MLPPGAWMVVGVADLVSRSGQSHRWEAVLRMGNPEDAPAPVRILHLILSGFRLSSLVCLWKAILAQCCLFLAYLHSWVNLLGAITGCVQSEDDSTTSLSCPA